LNPTVIPPLTGVNRGYSQSRVSVPVSPKTKTPAADSPPGSENELLLFVVNSHCGLDLQAEDAGDVSASASLETVPMEVEVKITPGSENRNPPRSPPRLPRRSLRAKVGPRKAGQKTITRTRTTTRTKSARQFPGAFGSVNFLLANRAVFADFKAD